jgi:hypothetical protein
VIYSLLVISSDWEQCRVMGWLFVPMAGYPYGYVILNKAALPLFVVMLT